MNIALMRHRLFAVFWGTSLFLGGLARADDAAEAAASMNARVIRMQRFIVSATRIEKNPWRYASAQGFEILSRTSDSRTLWWLDAIRRGLWLEGEVMPADWLPAPPLPYTVILDEADLTKIAVGPLQSHPIDYRPPRDDAAWGQFRGYVNTFADESGASDGDTVSNDVNLRSVDASAPVYATMSVERLSRCTPALPPWLLAGLVGKHCGLFRESFALDWTTEGGTPEIKAAVGPGTIWISLKDTKALLHAIGNGGNVLVPMLPLGRLFAEEPPSHQDALLWESEAALFARWALLGPGRQDPAVHRAFLELARRARIEPINERIFSECFGHGYADTLSALQRYLVKDALGKPMSVAWAMPRSYLEEVKITEATSDQIGRILGDRLRMEGDALGDGYGELGRDFLLSAGRTLERAYRNDNGLPPDVDPSVERAPSPGPSPHSTLGPPIGMKPFVVTADHLHDPRLQAVYGLYEHDLGNNLLARDFLEAAVRSRVVRPKAYLALADILDAQAKLVSTREDEKLSEEQAGPILKLLNAAFQQAPTADLCSRIIETWEGSDAKPAEEDIARIAEDAALFPRDLDLVYGAAAFCAQAGYDAPAVKLIKMGLGFATYDFDKDDFEQLRSTLRSQPKTP